MAKIDKILQTASTLVGEAVTRGALIVPPGSAAYKNIGGGSGYSAASLAIGAVRSKRTADDADGDASKFPRMLGLLAVSETTIFFCKTKKLGGQPTEVLYRWPAGELTITYVAKTGKMRNPAVAIEFADGTDLVAFGEEAWGIELFDT